MTICWTPFSPFFFRIRNSVIASTVLWEYWDSKKYHVIIGAASDILVDPPEYVRIAIRTIENKHFYSQYEALCTACFSQAGLYQVPCLLKITLLVVNQRSLSKRKKHFNQGIDSVKWFHLRQRKSRMDLLMLDIFSLFFFICYMTKELCWDIFKF